MRKHDDQAKKELSLLCLLADCATIADVEKTFVDKAAEKIFPHLKLEKSKGIALLILVLTGNHKQKGKPGKSDLKQAQLYVNWAKTNHATMKRRKK